MWRTLGEVQVKEKKKKKRKERKKRKEKKKEKDFAPWGTFNKAERPGKEGLRTPHHTSNVGSLGASTSSFVEW